LFYFFDSHLYYNSMGALSYTLISINREKSVFVMEWVKTFLEKLIPSLVASLSKLTMRKRTRAVFLWEQSLLLIWILTTAAPTLMPKIHEAKISVVNRSQKTEVQIFGSKLNMFYSEVDSKEHVMEINSIFGFYFRSFVCYNSNCKCRGESITVSLISHVWFRRLGAPKVCDQKERKKRKRRRKSIPIFE